MLSSITCRQVIGSLAEAFDDSTSSRRRMKLFRHLAGCPSCSAYSKNYEATLALVREAYRRDVPDVTQDDVDRLIELVLDARLFL